MEIAMELIEVLTGGESMMWVVGGGPVVSENNSKGIQKPERHNNSVTVEAENWHFHLSLDDVAGIQFVETKTHGERLSYYVRFSGHEEQTLLRSYFPNPFLDENYKPTPLQEDRLKVFTDMRDRYVGREGIVFVHYVPPSAAPAVPGSEGAAPGS